MAVTAELKCAESLNDKLQEVWQYDAKCGNVQPYGSVPDKGSSHNHTLEPLTCLRVPRPNGYAAGSRKGNILTQARKASVNRAKKPSSTPNSTHPRGSQCSRQTEGTTRT